MMNKKEEIERQKINENEKNESIILKKTNLIQDLEEKLKDSEKEILEKKNTVEQEITTVLNRSNKEFEKHRKFSLEKLLVDFLPIADSLERALDLIEKTESNEIFKEIKKKLKTIFNNLKDFFIFFHVKKIDDINVSFDPSVHQAMSIQYTNEIESDKVVTIMQPGYILYESRLLRPAMVVVSKKKT